MVRTFAGRQPRIDATAFVHSAAEIIGAVTVGKNASIWPGAVLRGDVDRIVVGARTNIQDGAVVHCREGQPAVLGAGITVGHGAIIHGARIGDRCLVGMGAIVMEARIGRECLIAAGALVPKGFAAPPRTLIMGMPAKAVRALTSEEVLSLKRSEDSYVKLAARHAKTSRAVPR
jgi:carbonic anhydrase/acetyltransferase-like protein (isoleucine patch superfamily)